LNLDLQSLGDPGQFVIEDRAVPAFDLRDLRLIHLNALPRQARDHVLLCNLRARGGPQSEDGLAGDVASFGFQSALEGAPMLLLFGTRIILSENKRPVIIMPAQTPLAILCVDDHTLVGDALVKLFTAAGYVVERADDGEAAWRLLAPDLGRFNVVITDHQMPQLTGLGLVERLRAAKFAGRIIVYSGGLSTAETGDYERLAVDAIVNKGPDSARLLAIVEAFHGES
jgi:CheY-like chemotaxis protein